MDQQTAPRSTAAGPAKRAARRGQGRARRVIERAPALQGWQTSDDEEIERRRWRGKTEISVVEPLEAGHAYFGTFRVHSTSGGNYSVEVRSLDDRLNTCGCADYRVSGLGTCKHIEGTLAVLRRRGVRAFTAASRAGSPRVELFVPRNGDAAPRILWPRDPAAAADIRPLLRPFLDENDALRDIAPDSVEALMRAVEAADPEICAAIRISHYLPSWIDDARRRDARVAARAAFLAEVAAGQQTFDVLQHPLLPYQREGMLHLAFGERALLADDMGLGKTIQAIAASELLRRQRGIARVLIVCPASLKGEWQEQIARFSGAATLLVNGSRAQRLAQYAMPDFFTVVNYEQVVSDAPDINRIVRPDVVILDEAQRIKNWHTKTAHAVKSLQSPYAFVLTGTPLENRIDEVYSIVQYLDPGLLGPLFRFNRDFYQLDERGRPVDYKNLDELTKRLRPVMLRRRKRDVETELPGRTVTNFLVPMAEEQRLRYEDYKSQAARLIHAAQRRPLTQQEFERLQRLLACMRMVCDTPYILDQTCRISPKLEELERVLSELAAEPDRKIILFSEWERMLFLVRELAQEMGLEFAWHTGSVPQDRRRAEITRFKNDPGCRLFLSTDSGSVGLNLQAASAIINLDLPWNPAKLEQRIARAWRKNQRRTVDVINLVTEDSIEHTMLHLLAQKQALAEGVLDGEGDLNALRMPSGRRAFVDRLAAMMEPQAAPAPAAAEAAPPDVKLRDDLTARHGDALLLLEARKSADGSEVFLAVLDADAATVQSERERLASDANAPRVELLDRATYEAIERMTAAGLLHKAGDAPRDLVRSARLGEDTGAAQRLRMAQGAEQLATAERKLRMALLLAQGGFAEEAMPALSEGLALAATARALISGQSVDADAVGGDVVALPLPPVEMAASVAQTLAGVRHDLGMALAAE